MIQCSRVWEQLGKEILSSLDDLGIIDGHRNGISLLNSVCLCFLPSPPFFFGFVLLEHAPSMPIPLPLEGPSSDFSSIGPSQSASQISYQFPEPTKLAPNTSPEMLSQQQLPISDIGLAPPVPRRHSIASTVASSLYHTPATPATYTKESVKYAPAIALVVPASLPSSPRDINTPLASNPSFDVSLPPPIGYASESTTTTTTMYIPAAHAISEYEMPTATVAETGSVRSGGSGTLTSWRHSRGESQSREEMPHGMLSLGASSGAAPVAGSSSGPILSNMTTSSSSLTVTRGVVGGEQHTAVVPTRVGSVLVEVFEDPENNEEEEEDEEEEDDSELPVEVEDQLIKQGKLAVVENPRFMSEERRKELEREREKWTTKQPSDTVENVQQQQQQPRSEPAPEPESEPEPEPEGKKSFSFLQQHKRTGTQDTATGRVTFAPVPSSSVIPSTPTKRSPSKATATAAGENLSTNSNSSPYKISPSKRFFGSLKGLFVGTRPSPSSPHHEVPSQVPQDPSPSRFRDDRSPSRILMNDDDSDNESPTKTRSGFQAFLLGTNAVKKKDGSSATAGGAGGGTRRWSTRTDKNIRKLTNKSGDDDDDDEYDTYLSQDVRNNGVAGDIVVRAGVVGGGGGVTGSRGGVGKKRSASGTAAATSNGSAVTTTSGGGGGKKLKKTVPPSSTAAAPPTASALHATTSTPQRNDTTTTVQAHTPDPLMVSRKSSVKADVPRKRSASVDESMRRRTTNSVAQQGVGEVGQQTGGDKEVVVDLGKRRRVSSVIPATNPTPPSVGASARGIPAAMRTPTAGTSAVSKGYSSDTAAARAPPTVTPTVAATATPSKSTPSKPTPSKPTLTRQPSVGKTQAHPTSNPHVVENAGGSRQQPHVQPSQPQPRRQHSASSSGGGAIVLTAGATQPTGTLISRPGWDAQALPTAGGGLSRNNSILSGVSGAAGGSSSGVGGGGAGGGMSKKKKQRQTTLGHGMGSGTSIGRRSSLGSSSGHGGAVVQPSQPAQSLMSIVEDVAKHNREWSQESSQLLKNRNKIVGGGGLEKDKMGPAVGGMMDVVRAPRRFGRDELAQLDPATIKARVMETSTTTNLHQTPAATGASGAGGSGGRMFNIKAPGSIFDQRDTAATVGSAPARPQVYRQASNSAPDLTQNQQVNVARRPSAAAGPVATSTPVARSKRPAKSPLRSAMKNPSRTPSPLTSPFLVPHLQKQQALHEGSRLAVKSNVAGVVAPVPVPPAQQSTILGSQQQSSSQTPSTTAATNIRPTTMTNGRTDSASQRRKGKRQVKSASDEVAGEEAGDSTSTNDTGNEIFYTDDEDDDHHDEAPPPMLNGHAVGYTGSSDLSYSTTSTAAAVAHRLPPTTTSPDTSQPTTTHNVARRRKSVRVSLQPTFSPSPPAVEYDDKEEQPWEWKQDHRHTTEGQQQVHVHAPVPVAAGSSLLLNPVHHRQKAVAAPPPQEPSARAYDIWEDSDEDVEYQNAKLLLTRAAKKEKDMNMFAARSRS